MTAELLALLGWEPALRRGDPGHRDRLAHRPVRTHRPRTSTGSPARRWAMRGALLFVGMAAELRTPPALGLVEQVCRAVPDRGAGRWQLYLTHEQMESAAYGFWLHQQTGSAAEANRFARGYGVVHQSEERSAGGRRSQPL
ncbi:DUF6417 family protein [Streptomyces sp. NPDC002588]|uniref:DUF6417 family protein n=1 Tax=Streptomyces sp. NPDC002588 TaxID=3154419 RepID=UPI003330E616